MTDHVPSDIGREPLLFGTKVLHLVLTKITVSLNVGLHDRLIRFGFGDRNQRYMCGYLLFDCL